MPIVIIKGSGSQSVELNVLSRPYSNADNKWDLNWLNCNIKIAIPGFRADYLLDITTGEIKTFYEKLKKIYETLRGRAELTTLEDGIFIAAEMYDKTGKITWEIKAQHPEGSGAKLEFKFESDQSYVSEILKNLKEVIQDYPVLNK